MRIPVLVLNDYEQNSEFVDACSRMIYYLNIIEEDRNHNSDWKKSDVIEQRRKHILDL